MPETYPDDTTLLGLAQDDTTGVEYIPTGQSPYVMAYRRMLYRLLRAAERANDLRVYPMGGRMVGVRGGRCFVGQQPREVAASAPIELDADAITHLYVDEAGAVQASTTGLPADRATFISLAEAVTDTDSIVTLTDLRGEAMMQAQSAALAGITATTGEINTAIDGVGPGVTAANLSTLTAGSTSTADALHRHTALVQQVDGQASYYLTNTSSDSAANIALVFDLPNVMADTTTLGVDRTNGHLVQRHLDQSYHLLGSVGLSWSFPGAVSSTLAGQLVGPVAIEGEVVAVILSCGLNTVSSDSGDGLSLSAFVNGSALTTAPAMLTATDGAGFVSTDQGAGSGPTLATTGAQNVHRGDLITLDLAYTANGTVTQAPTNVGVLIVVKAGRPI